MTASKNDRPLSPHLSIYRWQISMVMSIMHRMTGIALTVGSLVMVAWLWSAAYAPHWYDKIHACLGSVFGQILLFSWTFAFYYHLFNGIRHLLWDTGAGFKLQEVNRSGMITIAATILLTVLTWACVLMRAPGVVQ